MNDVQVGAQDFKRQVLLKHLSWYRRSDTERPHQLIWQTSQHAHVQVHLCSPVVLKTSSCFTVPTLYNIFFYISPAHSFCSQFFYVSATCWSSRLSFYPLWHRVSCLSDGLVLLGLPASFSSSACWCKSWATQLGCGSCSSRGERKKKKGNAAGVRGAGGWQADKLKTRPKTAVMSTMLCWGVNHVFFRVCHTFGTNQSTYALIIGVL